MEYVEAFSLKEFPQRLRSYIRVDPALPDHKEHYPDGPLAAFALTMCFAEHQPLRGRFRNRKVLAALLGKRARFIPFLIDHGDLLEIDGGSLYFEGWDEWQEGDWKVQERVERIRSRRSTTVNKTVTSTVNKSPETLAHTVNTPSEPLAVGGKRLAVSASQVVRYLNPAADPVLQLQLWWQEFRGGQISEHDKQAASAFVVEYPRLGLNGIQARILEYATWRAEHTKPPLGKLEFYRDTLREQEAHLADTGVQRPRESGSAGMERLSKVLAR